MDTNKEAPSLLAALEYTLAYAARLEKAAGVANPRNTSLDIPRKAIAAARAAGTEPAA